MGIFTHRDDVITASGAMIDLNDPVSIKRFAMAKRMWQDAAWDHYSELAEVHYPANFIGSSLSRFTLHLGQRQPGEAQAAPIDTPQNDAQKAAVDLIEQFRGDQCSQAEHLRRFGINWTIAADMWLIGTPVPGGSPQWETLSVSEILARPDGQFQRIAQGMATEESRTTLDPTTMVRRIWRAHPRWSMLADGALNALQDDCRRLATLNDSITSRLLSRLASNGVWVFPQGVAINGTSVGVDGKNPFFQQLLNHLMESMDGDPSKGALPVVVTGPPGTAKEVAHVTMNVALDRVEMDLRKELRQNIAMGMDLPPEVQTGLGDASHFSTWSIQDSSYRQHLLPVVDQAIDAWTRLYLQPALRSLGRFTPADLQGLCIVADGSNVVVRPNEGQDAREMWDRNALSDKALRVRTGATEDEAASDEELIRRFGVKYGNLALAVYDTPVWDRFRSNPEDIAFIQLMQMVRGHATEAGVGTDHPGTQTGPGDPGNPAGGPNPGSNVGTDGTTPNERVPVDNGGSSPGSPGRNAGQQPGPQMASAAHMALLAADSVVGAKLRARAQAHPTQAAKLKREPNDEVRMALSDPDMRELGYSDDDLLALYTEALADLRGFCSQLVGANVAGEFVGQLAMMKVSAIPIDYNSCHATALGVLSTHRV